MVGWCRGRVGRSDCWRENEGYFKGGELLKGRYRVKSGGVVKEILIEQVTKIREYYSFLIYKVINYISPYKFNDKFVSQVLSHKLLVIYSNMK